MPYLELEQGRLFYEINGSQGPWLVMIRGLGRSTRHWLGFEKTLSADARVLTVELPGIGLSTVPHKITDSLFDIADYVVKVMNHAEIPAAHCLGVSLGGMIVLAMGIRHPDRCLSVIPINTSIAGEATVRISANAMLA